MQSCPRRGGSSGPAAVGPAASLGPAAFLADVLGISGGSPPLPVRAELFWQNSLRLATRVAPPTLDRSDEPPRRDQAGHHRWLFVLRALHDRPSGRQVRDARLAHGLHLGMGDYHREAVSLPPRAARGL